MDTLLMTPGPVPLTPSVARALAEPAEFHHASDFYSVLDDCRRRLSRLLNATGGVAVIPGSGRVGLEAAITTTVLPGDRTLHLVNGFFSRWTATMAERAGASAEIVEGPDDRGFPPEVAARAIEQAAHAGRPYRLVSVAHCETSTAQLTDIAGIVAALPDDRPLVLVDAISSVPGTGLDMSRDGVDLCVLASQKALAAPMGLSVVAASHRVVEHWASRPVPPNTWTFDLLRWQAFDEVEVARPYPVVPSTHLVRALHEALVELEDSWGASDFHGGVAIRARTAFEAAGLAVFGHDPSPTVTPVTLPVGIEASRLCDLVLAREAVRVVGGMGTMRERLVRIPHMGVQARSTYQRRTIGAIIRACSDLGAGVDVDAALEMFDSSGHLSDPRSHSAEVSR